MAKCSRFNIQWFGFWEICIHMHRNCDIGSKLCIGNMKLLQNQPADSFEKVGENVLSLRMLL